MSIAGVRTRNVYDPESAELYPLSRSKIDLFLSCPRCFYLDRRCGIGRIDSLPYTLNLAVDELLKKEFDIFRAKQETHPLMELYGIEAVPFMHPELDAWRDMRKGVRVEHDSGFIVFGALDDVWVNPEGELYVVDYKATSTERQISIDGRDGYKRQMDVYQWLLRSHGFSVSPTAYFVFANAQKSKEDFSKRLDFTMQIVSYEGSSDWVDDALYAAAECLQHDLPPPYIDTCEWCAYRRAAGQC